MTGKNAVKFDVQVPLLRLEIRAPCPNNRQPRSGSLAIDVHSLNVITEPHNLGPGQERTVRIEGEDSPSGTNDWINDERGKSLVMVKLGRVLVAYASFQDTKAQTILSLGALRDRVTASAEAEAAFQCPTVLLQSLDTSVIGRENASALLIHVPSLRMNVEKAVLDGIQIWVDDASQWSEKTFGNGARSSKTSTNTSPTTTRNPSLIGSRYFVQRTGSGATESDLASTLGPRDNNQEFVVKAVVSEGKQAFDCCV